MYVQAALSLALRRFGVAGAGFSARQRAAGRGRPGAGMDRLRKRERKRRFNKKSKLQMRRLLDLVHKVEDQLMTAIQDVSKIREEEEASRTTRTVPVAEESVTRRTAFWDCVRENRVGEGKG